MSQKLVQRSRYKPTKGVDLKSSPRNQTEDYLSDGQNMRYDENFNLGKRFGFQKICYGTEVYSGIVPFTTTDYKGISKTELIGFGRFPYRLVKAYSTITNVSGATIILDMRYTGARWEFNITTTAGASLLQYNMTGAKVGNLVTAIDGIAATTCYTPAAYSAKTTAVPAEFSEMFNLEPLANGYTRNIYWYYWEKINCSTFGAVSVMNTSTVDVAWNTFTVPYHNLVAGDVVQLAAGVGGTIPNPLAEATNYYVVASPTWNTFQLETAPGAGAINITNVGAMYWTLKLLGGQQLYSYDTNNILSPPASTIINSRLYSSTALQGLSQSTLYGDGSSGTIESGWSFPVTSTSIQNPFTQNQKHICKYDGQTWQRIHAPRISCSVDSAGATVDCKGTRAAGAAIGSRGYRFSVVIVDKTGNVTESDVSPTGQIGGGGISNATVYWPYENNALSGFMDHWAQVNGATATAFTLPVDAGHTMVVGDIAYFWDSNQSLFISREVTTIAANSITVSGSPIQSRDAGGAVSVLDNALITANTRLAVWRTSAGTTGDYYLVEEIPFVIGRVFTSAVALYLDDIPDASLGAVLVPGTVRSFWPPMGVILSNFGGQLCVSGVSDSKNTVFFSSGDDNEAFPLATNSFSVDDDVTAIGGSGPSLGVFSNTKTNIVSGDLASFNFRVDKLSENIGCNARDSIQEVEEGVIMFQTKTGPFMLINGRQLKPVGDHPSGSSIIEPYFTALYPTVTSLGGYIAYPTFSRSTSASSDKTNQYILNICWGNGYPGVKQTLVYDYRLGAWCPFWSGVEWEFSAGVAFLDDELFGMQQYPGPDGINYRTLWKQVTTKGALNFQDHTYPVVSYADTFWDSIGNPDLYKKYLWITLSQSDRAASATSSVRCQSYLNYSTTADHSDFYFSFTTGCPPQEQKLKAGKANAMKFRFYNEGRYEDMSIQGWMYEVAGSLKEQSSSWGNQNR